MGVISEAQNFDSAMDALDEAIANKAPGIISQIESVSGVVTKLGSSISGMANAAMMGGEFFKASVEAATNWNSESMKLAGALGITTEKASALNVALTTNGISSNMVITASQVLSAQLLSNEKAFQNLGIATRDQQGHYRNTFDIMTDVNNKLGQFKDGTDRNLAGMSIYGQSWEKINGILDINSKTMADAKRRAEEMHIVVGPAGAAQTAAYQTALSNLGLFFNSIKVQVGNAVLPVLVQLGEWFSEIAPTAMFIFQGALKGIVSFFNFVTLGANVLWTTVKTVFMQIWEIFNTTGNILDRVIHGDLSGAMDAAKRGWNNFNALGAQAFDQIVKDATATNKRLAELWELTPAPKSPEPEGANFNPSQGKRTSIPRVAEESASGVQEAPQLQPPASEVTAAANTTDVEQDSTAKWAQIYAEANELSKQKEAEFHEMVRQNTEQTYDMKLQRLNEEQAAYMESWAMMADTYEEYESRKSQIVSHYDKQREKLRQKEIQTQLGYAKSGFSSMASLAESFYTLSGKKSKEAFVVMKAMKIGETIASTASAAMNAYSSMAGIPFVGPVLGAAAAAAAIAAGAVQIASISSLSPEGSGGGAMSAPSAGGGAAGGDMPSAAQSNGIVTQPVNQQQQPSPSVTIHIEGNVLGQDKWVEEQLAPTIRELVTRRVDFGLAPA